MAFNEAEWIEQYVRSARRFCDVVTVFDNGSTDGTPKLAADLGAEVVHMPPQPEGCLDYNDARFEHGRRRNECIAQLRGDWIFNMDADEVVHTDHEDILRAIVKGAGADQIAFSFLRYNLWCAEDLYRKDWNSRYPWLWKNGVGIHYSAENPPHEPLVDNTGRNLLERAMRVTEEVGCIVHFHYVRGWKAERHLQTTAEGIRKDAERLRAGAEPNVARLPWL